MKNKLQYQQGFSLVELMVVVGIIGILATLAMPRFQAFTSAAKMAEGKTMLQTIFTLEDTKYLQDGAYLKVDGEGASLATPTDDNTCGSPDAVALGFVIQGCQATGAVPRFRYTVAVPGATFEATAATGAVANNRVCPGKAALSMTINEAGVFDAGGNDCSS